MLVFAPISRLFLLVFPLAFLLLSFGVVWLLPLSLVPCLLMKVDLTLSAQLGACARTHAPAPARLKRNRRKPVLFLSPVPRPPSAVPISAEIMTSAGSLSALCFPSHLLPSVDLSCSHCPYRPTLQAVLPCCRLGRNNTPTEFPKSCKKVLQMGIRYDILSVRKRLG